MGKNTRKWKKLRMISRERKKAAIAARLAEKAGAAPPPPSEDVEAEVEANEGPLKKRVVLMEEDKTKGEEVEDEKETKKFNFEKVKSIKITVDGETWFNPLEMWDYGEAEKHIIPADDIPYSETSEYEEDSDDIEEKEKSMVTRSRKKKFLVMK